MNWKKLQDKDRIDLFGNSQGSTRLSQTLQEFDSIELKSMYKPGSVSYEDCMSLNARLRLTEDNIENRQ